MLVIQDELMSARLASVVLFAIVGHPVPVYLQVDFFILLWWHIGQRIIFQKFGHLKIMTMSELPIFRPRLRSDTPPKNCHFPVPSESEIHFSALWVFGPQGRDPNRY